MLRHRMADGTRQRVPGSAASRQPPALGPPAVARTGRAFQRLVSVLAFDQGNGDRVRDPAPAFLPAPHWQPLAAAGADVGGRAAAMSLRSRQLADVKAWAEAVAEIAKLLHATDVELEQMPDAFRQAALSMREQRFIPMPAGLGSLSNILPEVLTSSFYDRPIYDQFMELIDKLDYGNSNNRWALVITGDPGVGKSTFALRLILELAAQRKKIIYEYEMDDFQGRIGQIYVDFSDPTDIQVDIATDPAADDQFEVYCLDPQAFRLLDGRTPAGQFSGKVRTVVFASPDAVQSSAFTKTVHRTRDKLVFTRVVWMPWWTAEELVHAAVRLGSKQQQSIEDRFKDLGGIALGVLGDPRPSHAILQELEG